MGESHYQFMHRKQRRQRIIVILIICMFFSVVAVSMRECSQNIDEPLDKSYRPVDQISSPLK